MKKKREAKKAARQQAVENGEIPSNGVPAPFKPSILSEEITTDDPEKLKKIKKLKSVSGFLLVFTYKWKDYLTETKKIITNIFFTSDFCLLFFGISLNSNSACVINTFFLHFSHKLCIEFHSETHPRLWIPT